MEELLAFINSISRISEAASNDLRYIFKPIELKRNELFIKAGVLAKNIGFLEKGIIRAYYRNEEGQEYNKHFFMKPCFVGGYSSLISGKPNQIVQQALIDCIIWETEYHKLTALYDKHPDLERMARKLAELFFVQKEKREVEIVLLDADERYAIFRNEFPELEQLIPQYHVASYLGITPTQLSRIRRVKSHK